MSDRAFVWTYAAAAVALTGAWLGVIGAGAIQLVRLLTGVCGG